MIVYPAFRTHIAMVNWVNSNNSPFTRGSKPHINAMPFRDYGGVSNAVVIYYTPLNYCLWKKYVEAFPLLAKVRYSRKNLLRSLHAIQSVL